MSGSTKAPKNIQKKIDTYESLFVKAMLVTLDADLCDLYQFAVDSKIASIELVRQLLLIQQTRNTGRAPSLPATASSK